MNWLFAFLCLVISVETAIADDPDPKQTAAENLVPNGDFDLGEITPKHWQTIDGLSTFWVADADPKRGRVLKFDTDVQQAQAYVWWKKISEGTSPLGAPKKLPTVEPKYDTLAGLDGVWFWSDAIPVEKGAEYWLTLDAKGAGMLVWLVGYPEQPDCSFAAEGISKALCVNPWRRLPSP